MEDLKEAESQIHAKWINVTRMQFVDPLDTMRWFECSNCGVQLKQDVSTRNRYDRCPCCRAKMDL